MQLETGWVRDQVAETWEWSDVAITPVPGRRDVVAVTVGGAPRALTRLLRPGRMSATALESEVAWLQALGDDVLVRVPRVLPTRTGTAVGALDGPGGRWLAVSVADDPELLAAPAPPMGIGPLRSLGGLAATLHAHARGWEPPAWFRRPSIELMDLVPLDEPELPLGRTELNLLGTAQEEALDAISWAGQPTGLVHGDLRRGATGLDAPDGRPPLLLSFECHWTWWEQDLAGSVAGIEHLMALPSLAAAWLEGYGEQCEEDPDLDLRLAGALVMVRRLARLRSHPADAALADGTLDVAMRFVRSRTWLFD